MTDLSLHDYFTQLSQAIRAKKDIQLESVLAELETYDEWKKFYEAQPETILTITADSEEGLQTLLELAENPQLFLTEAAPADPETALSQSYPKEAVTEARKQTYSSLIEQQRRRVSESVSKRRKITQKFFKKYQEKLFDWIPDKKPEIAREIKRAERTAGLKTFEELRAETIRRTRKLAGEEHTKEIMLLIDEYAPEIAIPKIERPIQIAREVTRIVIENPDITTPEIVDQAIESGSNETEAVRLAHVYKTVSQVRTEGATSFGAPAIEIIAKSFPELNEVNAEAVFIQAWERITSDDSFIDGMTKRLGRAVVSSDQFQQFILEGNKFISQKRAAAGAGLFGEFIAAAKPTDPEMQDYIAALYTRERIRVATVEAATMQSHPPHAPIGRPAMPTPILSSAQQGVTMMLMPSPIEFFLAKIRVNQPQTITTTSSGLLQWGAQIGLEKAAKSTLGTGAKITAEKVGLSLGVKGLGAAVGGLPGWVIAVAGTKLLEWGGKIISGTIRTAGYIFSGGTISTILQGKPASLTDTFALFPIILIAAIVLLFAVPILPFLNFADFPQTVRNTALVAPINMGGEPGPEKPKCLDIAITTAPSASNNSTSIQYTVSVIPTCEGDLVINNAEVSFSAYGSTATTPPASVTITTQLTNGSFTFTVPVGSQLNDSVLAATLTLSATVGATSTSGVISTSTTIGNPVNDILIRGTAGYPSMTWCVKDGSSSVSWTDSDWNTIQGAVAAISKYPNFIKLVKDNNPKGIMTFRYNLTGGTWGCTASGGERPIMGIYNNGISHATYIITHEFGHRVSSSSWLCEFKAQGIMSEGVTDYGGKYIGEDRVDEDFAESFALFMTGGLGSLPRHYNFVQQVFGLIPAVNSGCK